MRTINISNMVLESKFNRFHLQVLFWCSLIIMLDGFDFMIFGVVLPVIMKAWAMTPIQAGMIGSYTALGLGLGSSVFGMLADKLGRKTMIMICLTLFSVFTGLTVLSSGPSEFAMYRFLAGLGLGGVMPNVVALMTEYAPKSKRSTLVSLMFCGFSVGGVLAPLFGMTLIPQFGWKAVFIVGALPILLLPFIYRFMPESLAFSAMKNQRETVRNILTRIAPDYVADPNDQYEVELAAKNSGLPVTKLFKEKRAISTSMFWIAFFMCLMMIYGLSAWLPKLISSLTGYAFNASLTFLLALNLGAIIGAVFGGWWADKWSGKYVAMIFFIVGSVALTSLGFMKNIAFLYVLVAIAGAATTGTQVVMNAYVSQYYPIFMRSTSLGWALGFGRLGAVVGPMMAGILISKGLPVQANFLAFASAGIIAAIAISMVSEKYADNRLRVTY